MEAQTYKGLKIPYKIVLTYRLSPNLMSTILLLNFESEYDIKYLRSRLWFLDACS